MSVIRTNAVTTVAGKPLVNSTGSILQVVTNNIGLFTTITATTETLIYNPAIIITPTSSTSLIFFDIQMFAYQNSNNTAFYSSLWLRRNSLGAAVSSSQNGQWGDWTKNWGSETTTAAHADFNWSCWDFPGTTSPVSYLLTGKNHQAGFQFVLWHTQVANDARQMQITAFEVSK